MREALYLTLLEAFLQILLRAKIVLSLSTNEDIIDQFFFGNELSLKI